MTVDLSGQVALVTGASSGLGRRFATTLARAGAVVAAVGRSSDRLAAVVAEIDAAGGRGLALAVDVRQVAQLLDALEVATDQLGLPTILVNCAGIVDAERATRMTPELIDAVIETNVRAPFVLSAAFAAQLMAVKQPGRIVNVSSMAAFVYDGNAAALYSTTKAAVNRMTEALAVEWSRFHVNVNAIAPGYFRTEMLDEMFTRTGDLSGGLPRGRVGLPEQLDSTLLYLVAPASEAVTGTVIRVDDGQLVR